MRKRTKYAAIGAAIGGAVGAIGLGFWAWLTAVEGWEGVFLLLGGGFGYVLGLGIGALVGAFWGVFADRHMPSRPPP